ncbi:signal peptidase II [Comamonas sp. BIGb0124]|uniref:signal peptidase II n=1 Tax=Comamonas sp. BIGb0124 TaxID=2485130 RepID=UPI000F465A7E|nr:signal peptidase II [Comamonas sp. BIGb0124]ROR17968.1 signal peptidase II [Comamonas sp. BIGb0124]
MSTSTSPLPSGARSSLWPWLGLALAIIVLDQLTKQWILSVYAHGEGTVVTGFFNIVRAHNPGAAFSFLAEHDGWQRWFFTVIGVGASILIVWLLRRHAGQTLFCFALACIMGGALGNVVDRLMHGYVVDFLDFHWAGWHYPSFNVADMGITLGAICLIVDELRRMRRAKD